MKVKCLLSFDFCKLLETATTELKVEDITAATEPILLGLKDTATEKVNIFFLNAKVHVSINHVFQFVWTCHLTRLGNLWDADCYSIGFLTELSYHG